MNGDNVILACKFCGWTASARSGDILVSVLAADGACSEHKVVRT